jgi:hypothetical protein
MPRRRAKHSARKNAPNRDLMHIMDELEFSAVQRDEDPIVEVYPDPDPSKPVEDFSMSHELPAEGHMFYIFKFRIKLRHNGQIIKVRQLYTYWINHDPTKLMKDKEGASYFFIDLVFEAIEEANTALRERGLKIDLEWDRDRMRKAIEHTMGQYGS